MDTSNDIEGASAAIAVVDDECPVLEAVADLLESTGYTVNTFTSAQAFLESGLLPSIACLIADIRMPGMDGWELEALAHAQRPDLPILLMTGHDAPEVRHLRVRQYHESRLLLFKKPFDAQHLLSVVSAVVSTLD
jgi:FixJ family two-component response regulator